MLKCRNCRVVDRLNQVIADNEEMGRRGQPFDIEYWDDCGTTRCLWGNHLFIRHGKVFDERGDLIEHPVRDAGFTHEEMSGLFIEEIFDAKPVDIEPYLGRLKWYVKELKEQRCTCPHPMFIYNRHVTLLPKNSHPCDGWEVYVMDYGHSGPLSNWTITPVACRPTSI